MVDTYQWYLNAYDFLVAHWNRICRDQECLLGELPRVLERIEQAKQAAWNEKAEKEFPQFGSAS